MHCRRTEGCVEVRTSYILSYDPNDNASFVKTCSYSQEAFVMIFKGQCYISDSEKNTFTMKSDSDILFLMSKRCVR